MVGLLVEDEFKQAVQHHHGFQRAGAVRRQLTSAGSPVEGVKHHFQCAVEQVVGVADAGHSGWEMVKKRWASGVILQQVGYGDLEGLGDLIGQFDGGVFAAALDIGKHRLGNATALAEGTKAEPLGVAQVTEAVGEVGLHAEWCV